MSLRSTLFAVLLAVGALALTVEADDTVLNPLTDKQEKRNREALPGREQADSLPAVVQQ